MAKATVCIADCIMTIGNPGTILIGAHISIDSEFSSPPDPDIRNRYSLNMELAHASSATQITNAIKNRVISDMTGFGGPALGLSDIQVFGGPV